MSSSLLPPDAGLPAGHGWGLYVCMYVESEDREEK
jgi:hypothetical protein